MTLAVKLPFEDCDLMAQGQDLHILGPGAHRQQPQHRQPVRHGDVRQSKQHSKASSPIGRRGQQDRSIGTRAVARPDVITGTRNATRGYCKRRCGRIRTGRRGPLFRIPSPVAGRGLAGIRRRSATSS
jgi:hypothetical protein